MQQTETLERRALFKKPSGEEQQIFRKDFDEESFLFHHHLSEDPRFKIESIKALARRLPGKVHFSGDLPVDQGFKQPAARKQKFDEALDHLEDGKTWMILKKVYADAEYGPVLDQCLAEVEERTGRRLAPLMESRTMSLILSSPGQTTPYHVDADCNFLFQISGCKAFYVFDGRDRSILPEVEEEGFWAGNLNSAKYREENQSKARRYDLKPGNGVHVPVMYPHWVQNDNNISISLSVNFRYRGRIRGNVHRANHVLRKLGMRPRAVGQSKFGDSLKAITYTPFRGGRQILAKLKPGK